MTAKIVDGWNSIPLCLYDPDKRWKKLVTRTADGNNIVENAEADWDNDAVAGIDDTAAETDEVDDAIFSK